MAAETVMVISAEIVMVMSQFNLNHCGPGHSAGLAPELEHTTLFHNTQEIG